MNKGDTSVSIPSDDVATLSESEQEEEAMAQIDPTVRAVLEQGFANTHQTLQQTLARFNDGAGFAAQESKQAHLLRTSQYEAAAQNSLEQDGLAARLVQMKAAGMFPTVQNPGAVHPSTP